jgi:hypothetical protein
VTDTCARRCEPFSDRGPPSPAIVARILLRSDSIMIVLKGGATYLWSAIGDCWVSASAGMA